MTTLNARALFLLAGTLLVLAVVLPKSGSATSPAHASSSTDSPLHVELRAAQALVPTRGGDTWVEVDVSLDERARSLATASQPVSVALLFDHSGSMAGQKLLDARAAAHALIDRLDERDQLALVSFESRVLVSPLTTMSTTGKARLHEAVDRIEAQGGTNISQALEAAELALGDGQGVRRVVLVTDGHPTEGLVDERALADVVSRVHERGVTVTALGVGVDYDGMLMQHLAERGGGMYGFLADASALRDVLSRELSAARTAVSRGLSLTLTTPGVDVLEVAGRLPLKSNDSTVLQLADLHPGDHTLVFARLRIPSRASGATLPISGTARWANIEGATQTATATVVLTSEGDEARAVASRNTDVFERGLSAFASTHLVAAAAAYERGDTSTADSMLAAARGLFGMSADALAGEAEVRRVSAFGSMGEVEKRTATRSLEKKSLATFGKANEGY